MNTTWATVKQIKKYIILLVMILLLNACGMKDNTPKHVELYPVTASPYTIEVYEGGSVSEDNLSQNTGVLSDDIEKNVKDTASKNIITKIECKDVQISEEMLYSEYSAVYSGIAKLYCNPDKLRGGIVVCINAGHGSQKSMQVKTQCHPDGSPKVTGGSTQAGSIMAIAASSGMTFPDGTAESVVTLNQAIVLKEILLDAGYSVLMIRESDDIDLDNIARTILANEYADCHIALHWDSSESDKGVFYCSVPEISSYRSMEPVASTWEKSQEFGDCIIEGLRGKDIKIYADGKVPIDLTQTSYSMIPSIDLELGDKASDYSEDTLRKNAEGILEGINMYFGE